MLNTGGFQRKPLDGVASDHVKQHNQANPNNSENNTVPGCHAGKALPCLVRDGFVFARLIQVGVPVLEISILKK